MNIQVTKKRKHFTLTVETVRINHTSQSAGDLLEGNFKINVTGWIQNAVIILKKG